MEWARKRAKLPQRSKTKLSNWHLILSQKNIPYHSAEVTGLIGIPFEAWEQYNTYRVNVCFDSLLQPAYFKIYLVRFPKRAICNFTIQNLIVIYSRSRKEKKHQTPFILIKIVFYLYYWQTNTYMHTQTHNDFMSLDRIYRKNANLLKLRILHMKLLA